MLYYICGKGNGSLKAKSQTSINKEIRVMRDLFGKKEKSVTDVFIDSFDMEKNEDGDVTISFQTSEGRQGYGKQIWNVNDLDEIVSVLKELSEKGDEKREKTTAETIRESFTIDDESGECRFKSEPERGKRPTIMSSFDDFKELVGFIEKFAPKIKEKAKEI
jgi:hypothetical protein